MRQLAERGLAPHREHLDPCQTESPKICATGVLYHPPTKANPCSYMLERQTDQLQHTNGMFAEQHVPGALTAKAAACEDTLISTFWDIAQIALQFCRRKMRIVPSIDMASSLC
jgi:hypothetical protein